MLNANYLQITSTRSGGYKPYGQTFKMPGSGILQFDCKSPTGLSTINYEDIVRLGSACVNSSQPYEIATDGNTLSTTGTSILNTDLGEANFILPAAEVGDSKILQLNTELSYPAIVRTMPYGSVAIYPGQGTLRLSFDGTKWRITSPGDRANFFTPTFQTAFAPNDVVYGDQFGYSVAISADGQTLAAGAAYADSYTGAFYVYTRTETGWEQQGGKYTPSNIIDSANVGTSITLSSDGNTLAVGGAYDTNPGVGAVWIYTRTAGIWTEQAKLTESTPLGGIYRIGFRVDLSANGNILAAVANEFNGDTIGKVYMFERTGINWIPYPGKNLVTPTIGISPPVYMDSVALSANGKVMAVGGSANNSTAGSAWIFEFDGTNPWSKEYDISGTFINPSFRGHSVTISGDGMTTAVSVGDTNYINALVFDKVNFSWSHQATLRFPTTSNDYKGRVRMSANGRTLILVDLNNSNAGTWAQIWHRIGNVWESRDLINIGDSDDKFSSDVATTGDGNITVFGGGEFNELDVYI